MKWVYLFAAGLLEITWAVMMKYSEGFTRFWPSAVTVAASIASVAVLALALKQLPLGIAYAVWTGMGIVGTAVLGAWLFKEMLSPVQIACVVMILAGIVGLRLSS